MIWDESGLDMPHNYWLDMWPFGLSQNTLDFEMIQCGCMLSIVTIKVCTAKVSTRNSASSNLFCRARCWNRPMSVFVVDYGRTYVVSFGVPRPCLELMSGTPVVGYLLMSIYGRSSPCGSEFCIVRICRWNICFRSFPLRPMVLVVNLTIVLQCLIWRAYLITIVRIGRCRWCGLADRWMTDSLVCLLCKTSP